MSWKIKHTATLTRLIFVAFCCERCGKVSVATQRIKTSSSFAHRGDSVFQGSVASRETAAKLKAQRENEEMMLKILTDAKNKDYRSARFTCKCSVCGNNPLWARMHYTKTDFLINAAIVVLLFAGAFSGLVLLDRDMDVFICKWLPILVLSFVTAVSAKIWKVLHCARTHKKIREHDEKYLPIIFTTSAEAMKKAKEMIGAK